MAYANHLEGPWTVYNPGRGVFHPDEVVGFAIDHVASPDVHVDHRNQRIVMCYHSPYIDASLGQTTYAAVSDDSLAFASNSPEVLGNIYTRVNSQKYSPKGKKNRKYICQPVKLAVN